MKWLFAKTSDLTQEDYIQTYNLLSPSRKEHITRMKKQEDKARSLAASYLIQKLLKDNDCDNYLLKNAENGMPYLEGSDLFVSISHSAEGVVCAISETPVGIDIEKIKPVKDKFIKYVCNDKEQTYVFKDSDKVFERFFDIWTAKEAYCKKHNMHLGDIPTIDTTTFDKQFYTIEDFLITIV